MSPVNKPDGPTFRDLYELQENLQTKLEKTSDRLSRMEKGFIALTLIIASPKIGGPDAAKLVSQMIGVMA